MPAHAPVPALISAATAAASSYLLRCAKSWPCVQARQLQRAHVLAILQPPLRQHILDNAMSTNMYQMDMDEKILLLHLLGDQSTRIVDVTTTGYQYVDEVFSLYRALTSSFVINLRTLGFVCLIKGKADLKYVSDVNSMFYLTLQRMKYLTTVTLSGIANTEILAIIGKTCHHLEYLDVSHSQRVEDEGLIALLISKPDHLISLWEKKMSHFMAKCHPCCKSLQFLGLSGTDVTTQSVCNALQFLTKLKSFGGHLHNASMCSAITFLYGEPLPIYRQKIVKLNIYDVDKAGLVQICANDLDGNGLADKNESLNDDETKKRCDDSSSDEESDLIAIPAQFYITRIFDVVISKNQCHILNKVCPEVFSVDTNLASLKTLHNFHQLKELCIECDFKCWCDPLCGYLESSGSTLESLVARDSINDSIPYDYLREWCPKLKSITVPLESCTDGPSICADAWESLTYANILMVSTEHFISFCSVAVNLTELCFVFAPDSYSDTLESFNDGLIGTILNNGGLSRVRKVFFGRSCLSGATVLALTSHCQDLHSVGYLDLWRLLTDLQLAQVQDTIKRSNWQLRLLRSTDFPGNELHFK